MASVEVAISSLPSQLTEQQAVDVAYRDDLDWIHEKIERGMSVLVECDKQLVLYLYRALRKRLKDSGSTRRLRLIGGPSEDESGQQGSIINNIVQQLSESIFSGEPDLVLAIPHLDVVVTTTKSGLSDKAREVVAMLYENPEITLLAFRDPSFEIPKAIAQVFTSKRTVLGLHRERLPQLITQAEARKFGLSTFNPFALFKYVSGLNAVRFRQVMSHIATRMEFNPDDSQHLLRLYGEIREMTLFEDMEIPNVDLTKDIGGYDEVKRRLREEILDLLALIPKRTDPKELKAIEEIIPKGLLLVGPPGTGKTFFAKAMACILDATVTVVSGPELKSKWVGESEENLRMVFAKARKSAPSIIIFDEIDSFATTRGTYTGSGVEHSMVNQLLTEMDGFRKEELVFVVGTTNFPESLDPALLRPGRFELQIEIPYPNDKDRKEILEIYRRRFELKLSDELLEFLVQKTGGYVDEEQGVRYSGDHLYAVCRALMRNSLRQMEKAKSRGEAMEYWTITEQDCLDALSSKSKTKTSFTAHEERAIAIHEAGHAVVAHFCPEASHIERVTIATGDEDTLGYTLRGVRENKYVTTRGDLEGDICVLLGGRAGEEAMLTDISVGVFSDLRKATDIARAMVEDLGMDEELGLTVYGQAHGAAHNHGQRRSVAEGTALRIDAAIDRIIAKQLVHARALLADHRVELEALVEALVKEKTLFRKDVEALLGPRPKRAS